VKRCGRDRGYAHIAGNLLFLSGHVPQRSSTVVFPRGGDLTVEQGRETARLTGLNVIAGIKLTEVHKVSSGLSDLLADVFGPERGIGGRATIGVMALAGGNCFESWVTVELG
jgi:hypothetical protein